MHNQLSPIVIALQPKTVGLFGGGARQSTPYRRYDKPILGPKRAAKRGPTCVDYRERSRLFENVYVVGAFGTIWAAEGDPTNCHVRLPFIYLLCPCIVRVYLSDTLP